MDEKRMQEERKQPEGESVGKKLEDRELEEAAGGIPRTTPWADKKQLPTQ